MKLYIFCVAVLLLIRSGVRFTKQGEDPKYFWYSIIDMCLAIYGFTLILEL